MRFFLCFFFCYSSFFSSAVLLEKVMAQSGEKVISLVDVKTFQKREKLGLIPDSLLLDSLYKNPNIKERSWLVLSNSKDSPSKKISKNSTQKKNLKQTSYKKPSKKELALNYLILREMIWQKQKSLKSDENQAEANQAETGWPEPDITEVLKKKQAKLSSSQFPSHLKKAGFNSLLEYKAFLKKEKTIDLFLMRVLMPKISLSNREIESVFLKTYKRKLFSDYEYDFLLISFGEEKKEKVLQDLQKKETLRDFKKWAEALDLSFKNSKLKSTDISNSIKKELDKLSVSQVSPVLFINSSYYLLKLNWKEALIDSKDKEKKFKIEEMLSQQKLLQELSSWIQSETKQFFIEVSSL